MKPAIAGALTLAASAAAMVFVTMVATHADSSGPASRGPSEPSAVQVPSEISAQVKSFEPSGATYLADLGVVAVVSDDTDKKDTPFLFLMKDGVLDKKAVVVEGLGPMTDMESISQDEKGRLYILASLGLSKKGKDKKERNLLVRAERKGGKVLAKDSIELRALLLAAIKDSAQADIKAIASASEKRLDVEAHYLAGGRLYLGLKDPQPSKGVALILDAGPVDEIFSKKSIADLKVAHKLDFKSVSKDEDLLSEALPDGGTIWLATTTEKDSSKLWALDLKTGKLKLKRTFAKERLEALAKVPGQGLILLFDQGSKAPLWMSEAL